MSFVMRDGVSWTAYYPAGNSTGRLQVLVHNGHTVEVYDRLKEGAVDDGDLAEVKRGSYDGQTDDDRGALFEDQANAYLNGRLVCKYEHVARVWVGHHPPISGELSTVGNTLLIELGDDRVALISGMEIKEFDFSGKIHMFSSENVSNDFPYAAAATSEGLLCEISTGLELIRIFKGTPQEAIANPYELPKGRKLRNVKVVWSLE